MSKKEKDIVDKEVKLMLQKGVIKEVHPTPGQFISTNFVRPKKEANKFRPIKNLKQLNKYIPAIYSFQNGRHEECNGPSRGRGLHGGNSPERGLLAHTNPPVIQEIPQISVETETIRDAGSSIWGGTGTTNFHKTYESSLNNIKETTDNNNSLSGQPVDKQNKGGGNGSQGFSDLSTEKSGLHNKLGKVCHGTNTKDRVPGMILDSREMTISLPTGKNSESDKIVSRHTAKTGTTQSQGLSQISGETLCNTTNCVSSPSATKVLTAGSDSGPTKRLELRVKVIFYHQTPNWNCGGGIEPLHLGNPEMVIYSDASSHLGKGAAMEVGFSTGCVDPSRKDHFT